MSDRGYQENFYSLYSNFQNHEARHKKGEKIIFLLRSIRQDLDTLSCLDIGCSSGVITSFIRPYFKSIVGIDIDQIGLGLISPDQKQSSLFLRGDSMRLPFPDKSFDAVICSQVYEHVPNDLVLFSEIERVIRPNGIVFFSGPNKLFPIEMHYYLPFLQLLPERIADSYLKLTKKGTHFYERSRTIWNLKKIFKNYDVYDMTIKVLRLYASWGNSIIHRGLLLLPKFLIKVILPFIPNFNWVLIRNENTKQNGFYKLVD